MSDELKLRTVLGRPLTNQEVDGNFLYIDGKSQAASYNASAAVSGAWSREPAAFAPYGSDDDETDGTVIDSEGHIQGGLPVLDALRQVQRNAGLVFLAPYASDDDESDAAEIDLEGWIIGGLPTLPGPTPETSDIAPGAMYVRADFDARTLSFASWFGPNRWWRVHLAPHGPNELINVDHMEDIVGPDIKASGEVVPVTSTDWFPPRQDGAVNGGDTRGKLSTGGSHLIGTSKTVEPGAHYIIVDGRRLQAGDVFDGFANVVQFGWVDQVTSYNTTVPATPPDPETRRFTKDVYTSCFITPLSLAAMIQLHAKEQIVVYRDGGFQMTGFGFEGNGLHYNDTVHARVEKASFSNAASKASAPEVWATSLYQAGRGYQTSWIDRSFGLGDGSQVADSWPLAYRNTGGTWKFYHSVVERQDGSFVMQAGDTYAFAGGYAWTPEGMTTGADSAFLHTRFGKRCLGYAFLGAAAGLLYPDPALIGKNTDAGAITPLGLQKSATGYETGFVSIQE